MSCIYGTFFLHFLAADAFVMSFSIEICFLLLIDGVLICSGRHNKIPQNKWVKPQKLISHSSGSREFHIKVQRGALSGESL